MDSSAFRRPGSDDAVPNAASQAVSSRPGPPPKVGWLDLPHKDQLAVLAVCRLSEPLSSVCLLPYIFYLVRSALSRSDTKADGAAISAYSGLLVAAFPLAQFLVSLPWGRLSDSHGRKLFIVAGLAVSVVANAAFGLSRSVGWLLFWRALAGLANGNVGIMRTMTAEIVRERKFQTKAFLLLPLVFNSGMVASLAMGGLLADPVVNLPWLFGSQGLLDWSGNGKGVQWALDYPYALPAMLNAGMLGFGLVLAVFWLQETLPGKENERDTGLVIGHAVVRWFQRAARGQRGPAYAPLSEIDEISLDAPIELDETKASATVSDAALAPAPRPPRPPLRSILSPRLVAALVSFGLLPLHNSAFMHIFPVYLSTPFDPNEDSDFVKFRGGLGLRSGEIGLWLAAFGTCGILLQLFIYPRMQARVGTLGVFQISLVMFPLVYLLAPYLSLMPEYGPLSFLRWLWLACIVWGQFMARTMAIPSTVILLTEAAPAKNVLGTVHGAGNMLVSLARAVGPAVGGAVYAAGVNDECIGAVWWFYLVIVALIAAGWCFGIQSNEEKEDQE